MLKINVTTWTLVATTKIMNFPGKIGNTFNRTIVLSVVYRLSIVFTKDQLVQIKDIYKRIILLSTNNMHLIKSKDEQQLAID